jgi:hypothetical protein
MSKQNSLASMIESIVKEAQAKRAGDTLPEPVVEGARSAENTAEVKEKVPGVNVEKPEAAKVNPAAEPNTTASGTGEDPKVEEASVPELSKEIPAKSASDEFAVIAELAKSLLSEFKKSAEEVPCEVPAEAKTDEEKKKDEEKKDEPKAEGEAEVEGEKIAAEMLKAAGLDGLTPEALGLVDSIVKQAEADADRTLAYISGFYKSANEMSEEELMQLLAAEQGGGMPAEGMPAEAMGGEGMPAEAMAAGGAPAEGGDELDAIVAALEEQGITPEQLMEMVAEEQGGAPAEEEAPAVEEVKEAKAKVVKKASADKRKALLNALSKIAKG